MNIFEQLAISCSCRNKRWSRRTFCLWLTIATFERTRDRRTIRVSISRETSNGGRNNLDVSSNSPRVRRQSKRYRYCLGFQRMAVNVEREMYRRTQGNWPSPSILLRLYSRLFSSYFFPPLSPFFSPIARSIFPFPPYFFFFSGYTARTVVLSEWKKERFSVNRSKENALSVSIYQANRSSKKKGHGQFVTGSFDESFQNYLEDLRFSKE